MYEYSKVVDYCAAGPKKYSISYVTPKNEIKTKIKINGINQKNCIFENDVTGEKETKITHKNFKDMYFKTVNYNNTIEEDIKFLFKKDNKFILPDRLKKLIIIEQQKKLMIKNLGSVFIVHKLKEHFLKLNGMVEMHLIIHIQFQMDTKFKFHIYIYYIWKNYIKILKQYKV